MNADMSSTTGSRAHASPVLELRGVWKRYGGVVAIRDVDLSIGSGETVAVLGDNGAGKSTLVRMISGATRPSEGSMFVDGLEVGNNSPGRAMSMGVQTVYQNLSLVDVFSIPENFFLGREMTYGGFLKPFGVLKKKHMISDAQRGLADLGVTIPGFDAFPVGMMSGGQRQAIAIARTVHWGQRALLMLDEPTAALGVRESAEVLKLVESMTAQRYTTIIVSHNIEHVWRLCSRFVVLRSGQKVADVRKEETSPEEIVRYIVGANSLVETKIHVDGGGQ